MTQQHLITDFSWTETIDKPGNECTFYIIYEGALPATGVASSGTQWWHMCPGSNLGPF